MLSGKNEALIGYQGFLIRTMADFSSEPQRPDSGMAYSVCWKKNTQPRILYSADPFIRNEGEMKTSPDKHKLRDFITSKPALQEI